jgi:hypothetical protein
MRSFSGATVIELGVESPVRLFEIALPGFVEVPRMCATAAASAPLLGSVADSSGKIVTVMARSVARPFNETGTRNAAAWRIKDSEKNSASFIRARYWPLKNDGKDYETFLSSPERPVDSL